MPPQPVPHFEERVTPFDLTATKFHFGIQPPIMLLQRESLDVKAQMRLIR